MKKILFILLLPLLSVSQDVNSVSLGLTPLIYVDTCGIVIDVFSNEPSELYYKEEEIEDGTKIIKQIPKL